MKPLHLTPNGGFDKCGECREQITLKFIVYLNLSPEREADYPRELGVNLSDSKAVIFAANGVIRNTPKNKAKAKEKLCPLNQYWRNVRIATVFLSPEGSRCYRQKNWLGCYNLCLSGAAECRLKPMAALRSLHPPFLHYPPSEIQSIG